MVYIHKNQAIKLRKQGFSYKEIQQTIPVAKSTLSGWLSDIKLSPTQISRITKLGITGRKKGTYVRKQIKQQTIKIIDEQADHDISAISTNELWLIGITLYWAEGNKQNLKSPSSRVIFSNSDPRMIKLFVKWLKDYEQIPDNRIIFELYIHSTQKVELSKIIKYWSDKISVSTSSFDRIYMKNTIPKRKYHNKQNYGLVRIIVRRSTNLNRRLSALASVICDRCGIV